MQCMQASMNVHRDIKMHVSNILSTWVRLCILPPLQDRGQIINRVKKYAWQPVLRMQQAASRKKGYSETNSISARAVAPALDLLALLQRAKSSQGSSQHHGALRLFTTAPLLYIGLKNTLDGCSLTPAFHTPRGRHASLPVAAFAKRAAPRVRRIEAPMSGSTALTRRMESCTQRDQRLILGRWPTFFNAACTVSIAAMAAAPDRSQRALIRFPLVEGKTRTRDVGRWCAGPEKVPLST